MPDPVPPPTFGSASAPIIIEETTVAVDTKPSNASLAATVARRASIAPIPVALTTQSTGLSTVNFNTLIRKQNWLRTHTVSLPSNTLSTSLSATLVFAQEEAGTAVCISHTGILLTCAHCVAESPYEYREMRREKKPRYLLFSSGQLVNVECIAWDGKRDLALLQIVGVQPSPSFSSTTFPCISLALKPPKLNARLSCIGHPGSEDLETTVVGVKTGYNVLHVSTGRYHGYEDGQDVQDNSEIGALIHDCWTYWGHSGAPLIAKAKLVGLHSSWDDDTGMRRGVGWDAIKQFLDENMAEVESA